MNAVRAAVEIATEHGIRVGEPRILYERQALIVHLEPSPLVARIGVEDVFGPRLEWQRGAIGLVQHLAALGAAVIPPTDLLPAGPYERDGAVVSFWRYVEQVGKPDPREAGRALRRIHELGCSYRGNLVEFWPPAEIDTLLTRPDVRSALGTDHRLALAAAAELRRRLPGRPVQPLHGDAHVWNALQTREGPLWFDFDEACRGPLEWDAATMIEPVLVQGPHDGVTGAFEEAFGDRFTTDALAP